MRKRRDKRRTLKRCFQCSVTAILTLTICLAAVCTNGVQSVSAGESGGMDTSVDLITDAYVDQARYTPGENAVLTVEMEAEEAYNLELQVNVTHLTRVVYTVSETVELTAGEAKSVDITLELPTDDYTAYAVDVYLMQGDDVLDQEMTAVEVASDWSKYPRYAYLTKYGDMSDEEIRETLERLEQYHITGLFYYDVIDQHDKPLAGTVDSPDSSWYTLANNYVSYSTVERLIDYGHEYNMNSYMYNLIFAAYSGYTDRGISYEWGLYTDTMAVNQDLHSVLDSWESAWLFLFNPADEGWQDYYLGITSDALAVFDYDGLQLDSLGDRGTVYDFYGNEVNLAEAYVPLLNRLASELDTDIIFNAVGGYGRTEILANVDYDIVYEEVWSYSVSTYSDLKNEIDSIRSQISDDKGIVLAAYMNYGKTSGNFNEAGVLLTDAVLMASGASHMELGDTGMLNNEYYPGDTLSISDSLSDALRNYYSFDVAYENYLRDASYSEIDVDTYINGEAAARTSTADSIWCFTKENEDADRVINFINLTGVSSMDWVDYDGEQVTPEVQTDLEVKQYVSAIPYAVYLASPDYDEGIMTELEFKSGEDAGGLYITFTMPQLSYWNMAVIQMNADTCVYEAEDYYFGTYKKNDGISDSDTTTRSDEGVYAIDMQPGESITIRVSDSEDFAAGTYALSVYSCGNRESFEILVNGESVGTISRTGTGFGQDQMTLDTRMTLELDTEDTITILAQENDEDDSYYGWVDYLQLEAVSCNESENYINFLGGSLRMDYAEDYSKTCLRFGYTITIPEDMEMKSWYWDMVCGDISQKTVNGVNYVDNGDGSWTSNVVITGIPSSNYETQIDAQLTVIYTREDGSTLTATEPAAQNRTVKGVASAISTNSSAGEDELEYAKKILEVIEDGFWTGYY